MGMKEEAHFHSTGVNRRLGRSLHWLERRASAGHKRSMRNCSPQECDTAKTYGGRSKLTRYMGMRKGVVPDAPYSRCRRLVSQRSYT